MTMVKVMCGFCNKEFEKTLKCYNISVKYHRKHYCSKNCGTASKKKETRQVKCNNCGKEKTISLSSFLTSKTKRFFCNNSCAGSFSNKHRRHSEVTKLKIRLTLLRGRPLVLFKKKCPVCEKEIVTRDEKRITCSSTCWKIYKFGSLPFTKEEVVSKILELSQQLGGATPPNRQIGKLTHAACRFFGSWNKAIESVGLVPNAERFAKKHLVCTDGHVVDSFSEKTIDEWLFENNIDHDTQKRYPEGRFTCDFYLTKQDVWLEYWGLIDNSSSYREGAEYKKMLTKKYGLRLLEITPDDLYPVPKLSERLVVMELMT